MIDRRRVQIASLHIDAGHRFVLSATDDRILAIWRRSSPVSSSSPVTSSKPPRGAVYARLGAFRFHGDVTSPSVTMTTDRQRIIALLDVGEPAKRRRLLLLKTLNI